MWRLPGRGHGRAAVATGLVYFLSAAHEILALDAATGRVRWRTATGESAGSTFGSAVVVAADSVIAGDYDLFAFDRYSGVFQWRYVPSTGEGPGIYLGDADERHVFAGSPAGRIYAVDVGTGALNWSQSIAAGSPVTMFEPRKDDGVVAAGFTVFDAPPRGGVVAFDVESGRELWRTSFAKAADPLLGTGFASGPIFADDAVIASCADGSIYGFSRADGAIRWRIPGLGSVPDIVKGPLPLPPDAAGADYRGLAFDAPLLVAGSLKGPIVAYDVRSQREVWRYVDRRSGSALFGLASDGRSVYVPFASGHHVAIDLRIGMERWRTDYADAFTWRAAFDNLRVYLSGDRGYVAVVRSAGL